MQVSRFDSHAHRNRSDFCDCDAHRGPQKSQRFPRQEKAMLYCDLRVRWKVASDLRFRAAISEPKTPSFCRIAGDLDPSTRKSLASIAIVRFWCTKFDSHCGDRIHGARWGGGPNWLISKILVVTKTWCGHVPKIARARGCSRLFYKAPPRQFQPPEWKFITSKYQCLSLQSNLKHGWLTRKFANHI